MPLFGDLGEEYGDDDYDDEEDDNAAVRGHNGFRIEAGITLNRFEAIPGEGGEMKASGVNKDSSSVPKQLHFSGVGFFLLRRADPEQ